MSVKKAIQDIILWRGLNFLSVFIINVLLARMLKAADAGALFYFINNLSLLVLVLSFSLESSLSFFGANHKIKPGKLASLAIAWCIVASLLVGLVFQQLAAPFGAVTVTQPRMTAIFFIGGSLLVTFFSSLFFAEENFVLPNKLLLGINAVLIACLVAQRLNRIGINQALMAYFTAFLLQGIIIGLSFLLCHRGDRLQWPGVSEFRKLLKYAATAFLGNFIFFLVYRIDYWFVEIYCSAPELGNYIQASKIVQWLLLPPMMISSVLFPITAIGRDETIRDKIITASRILFWLYLAGAILLALLGRWIFPAVFGESFNRVYPVFILLIPGILALATLYPVSAYNAGMNQLGINVRGSFYALVVIVVLNLLFTPVYGIYGAAIASSIGYLVYFGFSFARFNRQHRVALGSIFRPNLSDYQLLKSILERRQ
jgi:O-antigen/teichoic acid export membrane protein